MDNDSNIMFNSCVEHNAIKHNICIVAKRKTGRYRI